MIRLLKIAIPMLAVTALLASTSLTQARDKAPATSSHTATAEDKLTLKGVNLGTHVYGPKIDAKDLKGKVVIFEYWGDRCPPCIASIPHIVELKKTYGDKLVVVANQVWTKDADNAKQAWKNAGGSDEITVINHGAIKGADHRGVPHAYAFDHEGKFLWKGNPHPRADGKEMDKVIKKAVANVPSQS